MRGDALEFARVDYFQDPGFSEWDLRRSNRTATIAARGTPRRSGAMPRRDPLRFQVRITVGALARRVRNSVVADAPGTGARGLWHYDGDPHPRRCELCAVAVPRSRGEGRMS